MDLSDRRIAVIGLGYVGLPLAVEFAKKREVVGFDIRPSRIAELTDGHDSTLEVEQLDLAAAHHLRVSADPDDLKGCGVFIVTVPTPIDRANRPDLRALRAASATVGRALAKDDVVIYESTVFPGCTREICVPVLEQESGLKLNADFFVGYSPERINPGDKQHRLPSIRKVTSGSTPEAAEAIDQLYASIITAGTYKADSIEVAEAAKVIENTQRDLNVALMNELSIIFQKLNIDTSAVLAAARTKWNFMPFQPGLVGGHCIGVDPYYLTHRAQEIGYHPEVILAGRRVNDRMGAHVGNCVATLMMKKGFPVTGSRILMLGLTFKENCPDLRNSKVVDVVRQLEEYHAIVDVHDPWGLPEDAREEYGIELLTSLPDSAAYHAIVLAVSHARYREIGARAIRALGRPGALFFDVKATFARGDSDGRL